MKKVQKLILWLSVAFLGFNVGMVVTANRILGNALSHQNAAFIACRNRQAVLADLETPLWTDLQRSALDKICAMPEYGPSPLQDREFAFGMIMFMACGVLFYVLATIVGAWKPKLR